MIRKITPSLVAQDILNVQPMTAPLSVTTTGSGRYSEVDKWFWVKPKRDFFFVFRPGQYTKDISADMVEWCTQTFGEQHLPLGADDGREWMNQESKFYFRTEEQRTMFMLRWSGDL